MSLSMIVAMDKNKGIGKDGKLPWYLPEDLKRFRELTIGKTVVMGRKTFESIGHPLKDRDNIVLSRSQDFDADCTIFRYSESVRELSVLTEKEVFIIGGQQIYEEFIDDITTLYITYISEDFNCDTFFPYRPTKYEIISRQFRWPNEKNPYYYSFLKLIKKTY